MKVFIKTHDPRASFQRAAHGIRPSWTCSGKSSVPTSASAVSYVFCADIVVVRARAAYACSLQPSLQQHSVIQSARVKVQSTKLGQSKRYAVNECEWYMHNVRIPTLRKGYVTLR